MTWTLKEARNRAQLTQDKLAEKSGVDQTTISALENFRRTNPTLETVEKLATALEIPMVCLRFKPKDHGMTESDSKCSTVSSQAQ